ncbi:MAG: hypothetical protein AABZ43_02225 [Planctomycetota bacterium]
MNSLVFMSDFRAKNDEKRKPMRRNIFERYYGKLGENGRINILNVILNRSLDSAAP